MGQPWFPGGDPSNTPEIREVRFLYPALNFKKENNMRMIHATVRTHYGNNEYEDEVINVPADFWFIQNHRRPPLKSNQVYLESIWTTFEMGGQRMPIENINITYGGLRYEACNAQNVYI